MATPVKARPSMGGGALVTPNGQHHQMPPRRKSLAVEPGNACMCGKGASERCNECQEFVCVRCCSNGLCTSCKVVSDVKTKKDKPQSVANAFTSVFRSKKNRHYDVGRTPDRAGVQSAMDAPASGVKGILSMFRRPSKNLVSYLEMEERNQQQQHSSPAGARVPRQSTATTSGTDSSEELILRLRADLARHEELLQARNGELEKLRKELERKPADASNSTGDKQQSSMSLTELNEAKARVADLQVEMTQARDEIFRVGADLVAAREREKQLEDYIRMLAQNHQQQQQTGAAAGSGVRTKSAVPPCVPFPNTAESLLWLESIRNGTYVDYWQSPEAQVTAAPGPDMLPLPPPLSSASAIPSVGLNGKKRSEVPPPPPLPAGLAPKQPMLPGSVLPPRGGSCPGALETLLFQKKRTSAFAQVMQELKAAELRPLYWNPLPQTKVEGTVWANADKSILKAEAMKLEIKALAEHFSKKPAKSAAGGVADSKATQAVQASRIQIIDSKRKQQIGIALSSGEFRSLAVGELKKAINNLDTSILTAQRVKMLLEMIPTQEEITQLENVRSLLDSNFYQNIPKDEDFYLEMAAIPRLKQRLLCIYLMISFKESVEQLNEDLSTFAEAIAVIRGSHRWIDFLALCLETGNFLNMSNNHLGGAWGFNLKEGLKKFSEIKSGDKSNPHFTLMHWIARTAASHKPDLFHMQDEFGAVSDASAKSVEELKADVAAIKRQSDIVKTEVDKSKLESSESSTKFLSKMVPFLDNVLQVQYTSLQAKFDEIEKDAQKLVVMHGENPQQTNCQQMFCIILEGVATFLKCHQENEAAKIAEQKQMLQQQNSARKLAENDNRNVQKRDQKNGIMKDTGIAQGPAKAEFDAVMAKRRRVPQ